ncbi:protein-export membrane protein SecF [Candidatus Nomurabacteria bacterium RIFCSPLOWO2_01_FULL_46_18]|uniref:Protein-export membrane protein SecF n=1 Tax=Candidatus Nomurabacteria bacterium RIFCSPLOWO2_01_FULL_46_18 TaxID=1801783 RepID=A0A1F6XES5_9BACT|nr:MAG: protein-export membrane protein SecF [Candidatus Nomurabacteria bacterium RIFCSPLOWO2_01_FULL_46_18]
MYVIKYKKIWYSISVALLTASLFAMFVYGFNLSIDFKGGTITEVSYADRPAKETIESKIDQSGASVRASGEHNYVIRTKEPLKVDLGGEIVRQNTIGPIAGAELRSKALLAITVVVLMIVLFITFAFRKVSKPVSSWKYGLATVVALAHDVIIPTGIFVYLGFIAGYEIDLLFVTGLLAILGYSVHDTIVVFDRVRENLINKNSGEEFETTVGKSVSQTFARSINTSVTIFITLVALYIFGPTATKHFALLLTIGVIIGTYSSIFIASPLLVTFFRLQRKKGQV